MVKLVEAKMGEDRSKTIYNAIVNKFIEILGRHGNPVWAMEELDYLIYVEHNDEFNNLCEKDQWEVRSCMLGLDKIYR